MVYNDYMMHLPAWIPKKLFPRNRWGDREFSRGGFIRSHGRVPNWNEPELFSDHLFKLMVDGSLWNPLRWFVTDKEFAKYYIAGVVGRRHVMETYRILRSETEVESLAVDRVPCVLKPTHASGHVLIHTEPDAPVDRKTLKKWLKLDYYRKSREQNYKFLERKIIIEEFFSEDGRSVPEDYKLFCFHGMPKIIQVDSDRFGSHTRNFYDTSWNRLPIRMIYPPGSTDDPRPTLLEYMLDIASRLSRPFSFIRVDLYASATEVRVGELTSCPHKARAQIHPPSAEIALGRLFRPGYMLDTSEPLETI